MVVKPIASKLSKNDSGFTILELIIATAIFSGALLILMLGFLSISQSYTRGLTVTETQNTTRNILNSISQSLQFGDISTYQLPSGQATNQLPSGQTPSGWFCADNYIFAYTLGEEVINGQNAIEQVPSPSCPSPGTNCPTQDAGGAISADCYANSPGAVELLGPRMRLAALTITPESQGTYQIDVKVVYGDDSFLHGVVASGNTYYYDIGSGKVTCTGQATDDFCATSELQTVVGPRIDN